MPESSSTSRYTPQLRQGEHVALVGTTGSGKTELAKLYLRGRPWTLIIDTKHELSIPGFFVTGNPDVVRNLSRPCIMFRPGLGRQSRNRSADFADVALVLEYAYERKGWTILIDEVYGIMHGTQAPDSFIMCLTRGRSRGITMWTGMQRPRYSPIFSLSEATHSFVFRLHNRDDQRRVADLTHDRMRRLIPALQGHEFIYFNRNDEGGPMVSRPLRRELINGR